MTVPLQPIQSTLVILQQRRHLWSDLFMIIVKPLRFYDGCQRLDGHHILTNHNTFYR